MNDCHCFIYHPTAEERPGVVRELEYAREIGDTLGIQVRLAQLTGKCPSRETEDTETEEVSDDLDR
jgi:hypothetical protein